MQGSVPPPQSGLRVLGQGILSGYPLALGSGCQYPVCAVRGMGGTFKGLSHLQPEHLHFLNFMYYNYKKAFLWIKGFSC